MRIEIEDYFDGTKLVTGRCSKCGPRAMRSLLDEADKREPGRTVVWDGKWYILPLGWKHDGTVLLCEKHAASTKVGTSPTKKNKKQPAETKKRVA